MPQTEKSIPATPAASTVQSGPMTATAPAICTVRRPCEHWWHSYREVLLSTEALAW
jgi:hypothetical protein